MKGKRVYIAGPYTGGDVAENVRFAVRAADRLRSAGHFPYVPHLCHFWHFVYPRKYEDWIALDREWVGQCEAIVRLPGVSPGADAELRIAAELNIPVYYGVEAFLEDNKED